MKIKDIRYWIMTVDLVWVFGALGLAIGLRYVGTGDPMKFTQHFQTYSLMVFAVLVAWILLYFDMSLDGFRGGWHLPAILSKLIVAVSLLMVVVLALAFLTQHNYSRLVLFYFALFFNVGLIGARCLFRLLVSSRLGSSIEDHRCVILGNGPVAREVASKIASHPELPFEIVGFLFPDESEASNGMASLLGKPLASIKTLQVLELLAQEKVQKLIIAMSQPNGTEVRQLIAECRKASIQVYLIPQWYDLYVSRAELVEIDGLPLLSLEEPKHSVINGALKRAVDVVLTSGILVLVSPLLLFAALFVYSKKGRAFRVELRCGKDGIPFGMYRLNLERHATNPERYERLFVRWSLTELPQLWNVLRGDMSLVGPRPESAERLKYYSDWLRQRLKVRGGVTGLAQVHGLRDQHASEDKTRFDLQYIFNWSPFLDLSLILQTVWTLAFRGLGQEPALVEGGKSDNMANEDLAEEVINVNCPEPSTD
jgi:lipopolysaccharide/colanic/teichoic acid biosynthesis glycosyltransferase